MINTMFLIFLAVVLTMLAIFLALLFLEILFLMAEYIYEDSAFIDWIIRKIQNRRNK